MKYKLLDDSLIDEIANDPARERWLILDEHTAYRGYWKVQSLDNTFFFDFKDIVGAHKVVSPADLAEFLDTAEALEYEVVFGDDPLGILDSFEHLNDAPEVSIKSTLEGTVNGLLPYQVQGYNKLKDLDFGWLLWSTGPQPLHSKIMTPMGWTTMGQLQVSNEVIGSDGCVHQITQIKPQGVQKVVRLHFKDGSCAESTLNHLWGFFDTSGNYYVRPLAEYIALGLNHKRGEPKWLVDRVQPIKYPTRDLPVDPYLLGAMLGDGSMTGNSPQIYSDQGEIISHIKKTLPPGMKVSRYGDKHFVLVNEGPPSPKPNPLKEGLKIAGVWGHTAATKFIPQNYLYADVEQRLSLLQGLMDTDGCAEVHQASLSSISRQLVNDIAELARGLGGRAFISQNKYDPRIDLPGQINPRKPSWRVRLALPEGMQYFRLERKNDKITRRPPQARNSLVCIEEVGDFEVQCISVDAPDGRYVTDDYILTHNTGKTAESIALTKHHLKHENFKTCFVFVTSNNRINTSRWYERLGELDSYVIDGTPNKRETLYGQILDDLAAGRPSISILNYEKVRDDFCSYRKSEDGKQWLVDLNPLTEQIFVDNDLLIFWDEASAKMKNRTSKLYKGITKCLYAVAPPSVNWEKKRPNKLVQYAMTATPVEVSPEDHFNVHRVLDGGQTLGTVKDFHERYAASFDFFDPTKVAKWRDLDDIALRTAFCTHMVDKTHPDIASQFPSTLHEQVYVDWDEQDRKTYDKLTKELVKKVEEVDDEGNSAVSMFAALGIAQMLCDAPTMVNNSAALREAYNQLLEDQGEVGDPEGSETALKLLESLGNIKLTNSRHTKILKLKEIITERHPEEKVLVYTVFNKALLPLMGEWFDDWGITYMTYVGSPKKKQEAEDAFREDPNIRVFLSSDAGSNSINLEMAKVGINYDLPWNYSTKTQREGRNSRRTSTFDTLYWYDLLMVDSVEDRRQALNERKKGYHDVITGRANAESVSARMTREELLFILGG